MSKPYLLGCPFCQETPSGVEPSAKLYSIECENRDCMVRPRAIASTQDEVVRAWNKRR